MAGDMWQTRLSLTQKVLGGSLLGFAFTIYWLVIVSETQLERAMLDQVYRHAQSYLVGISRLLEVLPPDAPREQYRQVLMTGFEPERLAHLDFRPREIYLYSDRGQVIAHTMAGEHPDKLLDGVYGQVIREGKPIISSDLATVIENREFDGHPTVDVIIPVRLGGHSVNAGLEAELDMAELMHQIRINDDAYEKRIIVLITTSGLLLFLFVWWLMHHLTIRHVRRFSQTMSRFGSGELEARIPATLPGDEIGELGRAINGMADNIGRLMREQEESYLQTLQALSKALEAKDSYTQSHSARVSKYSVKLGKHLGLSDERLKVLSKGALMHDLGKIGVPDTILNKPGPLTDEEYAIMRGHARYTATIMRPLHRFHEFLEIAAWHHEHWDGSGYPDGLAGENIPLLARIVSIADTWDAMTGDRVYRKGMSPLRAMEIMEREKHAGQWDPNLLQIFLDLMHGEIESGMAAAESTGVG
ncbi:MAG: HD domain-containing protein [Magnetococcales bacterium]|nr:HD domain-containing protein [Magnetococcales bacterium]